VSDEPVDLEAELQAARARIAKLEQEAETNRAFFARALAQANEAPRRGGGWGLVVVALSVGFGAGVLMTVALVVARSQPTALAPPPPERAPVSPAVVVAPVTVDAGAVAAVAPAVVAPAVLEPQKPDDRGTLNVTASSEAVVFIDGQRIGPAPVQNHAVQPGSHLIRVECRVGSALEVERKVDVPPFAEVDVDHRCE
jgi:hypothetical protein